MGDRIDSSLFQRQCALSNHPRDGDDERDSSSSVVTILEIGGKRPVDTNHCAGYEELRHYLDAQNQAQYDEVDPFFDEPAICRPRSMKLLFFPRRESESQDHHSPFSKTLVPDELTKLIYESTGLGLTQDDRDDDVDEPASPSRNNFPRRSQSVTAKKRLSSLDTVQEDEEEGRGSALVRRENGHMQEDDDGRILKNWTWELRYARSTTQTVADQHTTTYFCVNFPPKLRKRIAETIHGLEALAKNPLFMDTLIIDEMIAFYRDAIKSHRTQLLAMNDDDSTGTEMSIKLEELATHWRTILKDINSIQTHILHLRELAETRMASSSSHPKSSSLHLSSNDRRLGGGGGGRGREGDYRHHTRQKSSDVFGPAAAEIFQLQTSTCEFWTRCVNMYLERTTDRIRNATTTYRLRKTIPLPLRRRGSLPQLNRRLSNFTIEVAVQFQRNSSSVSTLALSFFSTIFFSPDGLFYAITYWWWIIATLIVPLTFIIMHLWFETLANNTAFLRGRRQRLQQQQEEEQQRQLLDGQREQEEEALD